MRRDLRKLAEDDLEQNKSSNTDESQLLLRNISTAVDNITDSLKNFVECVNALNDNNANVYNEFIKLVKIPTEDDIEKLVQLKQDIDNSIAILGDEKFINNLN